MKRHLHSLALRLLVPVLVVIVAGFVGYAALMIHGRNEHASQLKLASAQRIATLIEDATHFAMLMKRRDEVRDILKKIAKTPGVRGIRIYDKQGKIVFSSSEADVGQTVDKADVACIECHRTPRPWTNVDAERRVRSFRTAQDEGVLGFIEPIEKQPACSDGTCHEHDDQTVVGVLDVQLSTDDLDAAQREAARQVVFTTLAVVLAVGVGVWLFMRMMVRRPVQRLIEGTRQVAAGGLHTRIPEVGEDELGELARAFNFMTADLEKTHADLTELAAGLERKVVEKTHEIAAMQRQQMHVEKMASLGKLSAVVAHELNNPLGGILTYAKLVDRKLGKQNLDPELRAELGRYLGLIQSESTRCGDIVRNMLLFARKGGGQQVPVSTNELMDRTAMLVRHQCDLAEVKLALRRLEGDDQVVGDPGELQQALLALVLNAIEATTASKGTVSVTVEGADETVTYVVQDDGVGIPADVLPSIFEPFFSTKADKNGSGIGLAVVYGIARRHGGRVQVESQPGQGATFRLEIARRPPEGERPSSDEPFAREASG